MRDVRIAGVSHLLFIFDLIMAKPNTAVSTHFSTTELLKVGSRKNDQKHGKGKDNQPN